MPTKKKVPTSSVNANFCEKTESDAEIASKVIMH